MSLGQRKGLGGELKSTKGPDRLSSCGPGLSFWIVLGVSWGAFGGSEKRRVMV